MHVRHVYMADYPILPLSSSLTLQSHRITHCNTAQHIVHVHTCTHPHTSSANTHTRSTHIFTHSRAGLYVCHEDGKNDIVFISLHMSLHNITNFEFPEHVYANVYMYVHTHVYMSIDFDVWQGRNLRIGDMDTSDDIVVLLRVV